MPAIHERILCVAVLAFALCGCSRGPSSTGAVTAPTTRTSQNEFDRYDDPRFSADERRAVRAATEAVLNRRRLRPAVDQAFRYRVAKFDGDWAVTVWHVDGFKDGKPQFRPGGNTFVILDKDFKVKSTMGGE